MSPDQIVQSSKEARSIALNQRFDNGTRIDANLTYSGFIGLLAKKKWSADYARIGYKALKENFDIDDRSELAALVFAKTIIEMRKQDWMKRQFIVNSLGIDLWSVSKRSRARFCATRSASSAHVPTCMPDSLGFSLLLMIL